MKSPCVKLDYFTAWPNFGDLLSAKLIERLSKRPVEAASRESAELMAAGTLFGLGNGLYYGTEPREIPRNRLKLVWGSGFHGEDIPDGLLSRWYSLKILGVRGRLSENILRKVGYLNENETCALGDPGLLYADQLLDWKSIPKQYDLAFVPHRYDQEEGRRIFEDLKSRGISVVFVDVMNPDPLEPLRLIAASRKVLSSSLHGLIAADSMGIPNRRIVFDGFDEDERRKLSISHFKFTDYYSAFGLADPGYVMSGQLKREPESVIAEVVAPPVSAALVEKRKDALLESFQDVRQELAKTRRKVLIVSNGDPNVSNPFVSLTIRELQNRGLDVDSGVERFFAGAEGYDVVHFEWPEDLARWRLDRVTASQLDEIEERIRRLKRFGVILTYTRHNSKPHTTGGALMERLYRIVEENVDAVFHMGEFSRRELQSSRPSGLKIADYIVPHHLPMSVYDPQGREAARKELGIDLGANVVVAFGAFRNADEVRLVKDAFAGCTSAQKVLLAPRLEGGAAQTDNRTQALMLSAADVVFIQRISILNSGNLPLGFMYGKVVVGPRRGNVGEILEATGNPAFDPTNCEDAARALDLGFELARAGKGEANKSYAFAHWRPEQMAKLMEDAYLQLLEGRTETWVSCEEVRTLLRDVSTANDELLKSQRRRKELWDMLTAKKAELAESQRRRKEIWDQREKMKAELQEARTKLAESQRRRKELWDARCVFKSRLDLIRKELLDLECDEG